MFSPYHLCSSPLPFLLPFHSHILSLIYIYITLAYGVLLYPLPPGLIISSFLPQRCCRITSSIIVITHAPFHLSSRSSVGLNYNIFAGFTPLNALTHFYCLHHLPPSLTFFPSLPPSLPPSPLLLPFLPPLSMSLSPQVKC